jgi:hypothetical protein
MNAPNLTTGSILSITPKVDSVSLQSNGRCNIDVGNSTQNDSLFITGNVPGFQEINVKNSNTSSQSVISCTSNVGDTTNSFVSIGINNSTFNDNQSYNIGAALDTNLLASGGTLYIANSSQTNPIIFSTGKSTTPFFDNRMTILNNGNVGISSDNPTSTLQVNGSVSSKTVNITAPSYLVGDESCIILSSGSAQTLNFPSASSGRYVSVINIDPVSKNVPHLGLNGIIKNYIDPFSSIRLRSNGSTWYLEDTSSSKLSAFEARPNVSQSITSGILTTLNFNISLRDRFGDWDEVSSIFTCRVEGFYSFTASTKYDATAPMTGESFIGIKNITTNKLFTSGVNLNSSLGNLYYGSVTASFFCSRGDFISAVVQQNSGVSHPIDVTSPACYITGYTVSSGD